MYQRLKCTAPSRIATESGGELDRFSRTRGKRTIVFYQIAYGGLSVDAHLLVLLQLVQRPIRR